MCFTKVNEHVLHDYCVKRIADTAVFHWTVVFLSSYQHIRGPNVLLQMLTRQKQHLKQGNIFYLIFIHFKALRQPVNEAQREIPPFFISVYILSWI